MGKITFTLEQALYLEESGMLDPFTIRDFKECVAWQIKFYLEDMRNPTINRTYAKVEMLDWDKAVSEGAGRVLNDGAIKISKEDIAPGDEWKLSTGWEPKTKFEHVESEPVVMMSDDEYDATSATVGIDLWDKRTEKWVEGLYEFNTHTEAEEWIKNNSFIEVHDYWGGVGDDETDEEGHHKSWDYYWDLDKLNYITQNPLIK